MLLLFLAMYHPDRYSVLSRFLSRRSEMRSAFFMQPFCSIEKISTFAPLLENRATQRELSSAGSEHLPYKQRVIGSNPIAPTKGRLFVWREWGRGEAKSALFLSVARELSSAGSEHLPYKQRVIGSNPIAPTERRVGIPTTLFLYLLISFSALIPLSI